MSSNLTSSANNTTSAFELECFINYNEVSQRVIEEMRMSLSILKIDPESREQRYSTENSFWEAMGGRKEEINGGYWYIFIRTKLAEKAKRFLENAGIKVTDVVPYSH